MSGPAHFAVYDATGFIKMMLSCDPDHAERTIRLNTQLPYVRIVGSVDAGEYYIADEKLKLRPKSTAVLEGSLLKGVPAGAKVTIEGQVYEADGSDIELEFEHPGTYTLLVDAFPQREWKGDYVET